MDLIALAAAKNYANKVAAGITAARVEGSSIILTLTDGSEAVCQLPMPKDGISVIDLSIDIDGSLLCHMSDGTTIDAGYVPTVDPDLTNYYTKEEMEEKLNSKQDTLTAGNNITIEDNIISASGGNIPTYVYADYTVPTGIISDEKFLSEISQSITNCLTSGASAKARIDLRSGTLSDGDIVSVAYTCSSTIATTRTAFTYYSDNQWLNKYIETDKLHYYMRYKLMVSGTWSNNVFNATRIVSDTYTSSKTLSMVSPSYINANLLTKINTSSYTPTSDYNPATKKYVDDSISSAITDALGGSY